MVLIFVSLFAWADAHDLAEAKQLIDLGIGCSQLTEAQLESIGDYYMEQMHPGEAHEAMDKMMGGEGSESLKQMHVLMAKRIYCNEGTAGMDSTGMMPMMMNIMGGGGMMGWQNQMQAGTMQGMMGNWGYGFGYWNLLNLLYLLLLVGLIVLVWLGILKLWKGLK